MTLARSMSKAVLVLALAGTTQSCGGEPGGPQLAELEVFVIDGAGNRTQSHCTEVPVLRGGRALDEVDVAGEFSMVVDATPHLVRVSFQSVEAPDELRRELPVAELKAGFSEQLDVTTSDNRRFAVFLNSRCQ